MPCDCSRCSNKNVETDCYYMTWDFDVAGWFWMCDECVELYKQYITDPPEDDEEETDDDE